MKNKIMIGIVIFVICVSVIFVFVFSSQNKDVVLSPTVSQTVSSTVSPKNNYPAPEKPVIYLYPKEKTHVTVKLDFDGVIDTTYPEYHDAWKVIANPDGTIFNCEDGKEYSYLFWDGRSNGSYDFREGFIVKGSDTLNFLQQKLSYMGLLPKEYNEFIVYWLPIIQNNPYNLISFQKENYTETAKLNISPEPDSMLRVFMAVKPLSKPIEVKEQKLEPFTRNGLQ